MAQPQTSVNTAPLRPPCIAGTPGAVQASMDITRTSTAHWEGDIRAGSGRVRLGSGAYEGPYSFNSRMADGAGTNPEELLAAAHAGCFTMALDLFLTEAGHPPTSLDTSAAVHLARGDDGFSIPKIELTVTGVVPGIDQAKFHELAERAEKNCPVSKALAGSTITLTATLKSG
jgi:osmotically inducible protein OsmC